MPPTTGSNQGIIFIAILMNAGLFGLVSEQFYAYWIIGFKDTLHLRLFVVVQFILVGFQCLIMWRLAWSMLIQIPTIATTDIPPPPPPPLWEGPINSICQLVIILIANIFLASRIYTLTKSSLKYRSVIALSAIAFALGMVTNVTTWWTQLLPTLRRDLSIAWHAIQAVVECLITGFLSLTLLKARSGLHQSDRTINYIVRRVIQTGLLASVWAIAGLATWFPLQKNIPVYRIFDMTSGAVYTHAMFETLLSRIQLRGRLELPTYVEFSFQQSQGGRTGPSETSGQLRGSVSTPGTLGLSFAPPSASELEPGSTVVSKGDVVELEIL